MREGIYYIAKRLIIIQANILHILMQLVYMVGQWVHI